MDVAQHRRGARSHRRGRRAVPQLRRDRPPHRVVRVAPIFGYDLNRVHRGGLFGRSFFGHADFPTAREIGLGGATWVISTNPARSGAGPPARVRTEPRRAPDLARRCAGIAHVRTAAEFRAARAGGEHGAFIGDSRRQRARRRASTRSSCSPISPSCASRCFT